MRYFFYSFLVFIFVGCQSGENQIIEESSSNANRGDFDWNLPKGFPAPLVPLDNPMSDEKVELGRHLFYDKSLSGNQEQSCESCHFQNIAFSDGLANAVGSTGMIHPRSSQGLVNVAYYTSLTWGNPALVSIEKQLEGPLTSEEPVELGINDINREEVVLRFSTNPLYQELFARAYPDEREPITFNNIVKALASFTRVLISGNSAYDKYLYGDKTALNESQKRGMNLFFGEKAECFHCHSGFNFSDSVAYEGVDFANMTFHNTGLYNIDGKGGFPLDNTGIFAITGIDSDMGKFRAQSLRNVELTAPYMHDGSLATLKDVLDFYSDGGRVIEHGKNAGDGRANPFKSDLIVTIDLTEQEKNDIVEFLKSLTDYEFINNPAFANPFAD